MDLVVNHTSDEHPWFVESRSSTDNAQARLVLVAPAAPWLPRRRARGRADQLARLLLRLHLGVGRGDRGVLPAPVRPQAAGPQLGEPRGARGRVRDDALVGRPRRRRLPDGRHQPHLQGGAPRRLAARRRRAPRPVPVRGRHRRTTPTGPRLARVPPRDARGRPGRRRARRRGAAVGGGDAGRHPRAGARPITDPARRELDMVFTVRARERRPRAGREVGPAAAAPARPQGQPRPVAGGARPRWGGTPCTGTTTTSPGSSPAGATTPGAPGRLRQDPGHRAAPAARHALRLPGRGARHDERVTGPRSATTTTSSR